MAKKPRARKDAVSGGKRVKKPEPSESNPDFRCPDFCFHHTVPGYTVEGCSDQDKIALIEAIWKRSRLTWIEIRMRSRTQLGTEKIHPSSIRKAIPSGITEDSYFLALRFGQAQRIVGYREGSVFHIVWVDPKHEVY